MRATNTSHLAEFLSLIASVSFQVKSILQPISNGATDYKVMIRNIKYEYIHAKRYSDERAFLEATKNWILNVTQQNIVEKKVIGIEIIRSMY